MYLLLFFQTYPSCILKYEKLTFNISIHKGQFDSWQIYYFNNFFNRV